MKTLDVPFNIFIDIQQANKNDYIFKLNNNSEYKNHLGSMHASAMFALAEATSGEFLLTQFSELKQEIIPVVRKVDVKYSKPAYQAIYTKANFLNQTVEQISRELDARKRVLIKVVVDVYNDIDEKIMHSVFEWFILEN